MSNVIVDKSKIDVLANAISIKSGEPVTMTLDEMVEAVDGIETNPTLQNKSVVYDNPGLNTLTDTVVADDGYYGLGKVDVSVAGAAGATKSLTHSKGYLTESGIRKWEFRPILKVTKGGWVPQGTTNGEFIKFSAIGTGSVITPSKTAQTIGGANYMMEGPVTVSAVPMAEANAAGGTETFITESGVRKFRYEYEAYAETEGWVDEGGLGDPIWVEWTAVPSNTTVTPTESAQTVGGTKYMMEGPVTVSAIPSNYVGSGVTRRSSTDLTASGATVTAPAGYYESNATKTVASGTEGTPTATKGTVANNSVTVTPSVTNAAGYISGGTHTGTAVTVTASELVSGSQTITTNGTVDVTNLEEVVVSVGGSGDGGGPSYELTTIVPEQTVTSVSPPQDDQDMLLLTSSDVLVEGNYYIVTVNGQKRAQTAVRNNYVLYLADITDAWYSGDRTVLMTGSNDLYFCPWAAGSYTVKVEHLVLKSSGSGGVTRENIVPQQTITATAGYNGLTSTAVLIEGADYEYTVNGETRLGTAVDVNGTLQLGDGDYYWLEEGGCIATDGSVMYFRTSAAGTYTVKVDKITLANGGLKTQVIFPEQSVTATTTEQSGYSANISVSENITNGANYIVTMDGTAYLCYGKQLYGNNDVYCGDDTVVWGTPANARYPFMVATWGNGTTAWGVADTSAHTVKIEKVLSFDSAELGTKTITTNGTYTASTDDLDGYSSITVNVQGGSTRKIIIPEQEVNIQTTYTQITNYAELFTEGEEYIITLNGTEYTRTADEYYGSIALLIFSNSQFYLETTSMGNIFIDVNDTSMYGTYTLKVEQESGGGSSTLITKTITQNGTYSASDDSADGYSEVTVDVSDGYILSNLVPQQTVACTTLLTNNAYYGFLQNGTPIDASKKYFVTFDGTEYICEGYVPEANCTGVGDIRVTQSNAAQYLVEPFFIEYENTTSDYYFVVRGSGTHTIKIDEIVLNEESATLQSKTATPTTSQQTITPDSGYDGLSQVTVNAIPSEYIIPTGNKAITENGNNIDVAQYATVSVNVSGSSVNVGTVTTTNSSNQNTSISFTLPSGRTPKAFFCRLTSQIARNSNSRYYYVYDMRWDGSSNGGVAGNTFYMSSGTLTNVTSGYSKSQSNTTFTLSSTGSRSTSPGSFFNGTYELVYVY